jgi:chaperone modulatory protein CbpM
MIQLIISEINPELNTEELCHCANISETLLYELVEHCIAVPVFGIDSQEWLFNVTTVSIVKKATRIHRDLAIDWSGIALVLSLLDDIENLKADNEKLKKQLSRFIAN